MQTYIPKFKNILIEGSVKQYGGYLKSYQSKYFKLSDKGILAFAKISHNKGTLEAN